MTTDPSRVAQSGAVLCPFSVRVDELASMLNFELVDHPVYDGGELQWFDDEVHGSGMLAFLSRREDRRVDYYLQAGLNVDRGGYEIGGGIRSWTEIDFELARLRVADDGVDVEVRFTDLEGRLVEVRVDDRDGHPRRRAGLLAPVSAAIERPASMLLVWMPRFDLVRTTGLPPVIRIDGVDVATGRLPAQRLHRRHLIKYAAPVVTVELNRTHTGALPAAAGGQQVSHDLAGGVGEISAEHAGHQARLLLDPAVPDLGGLADRSTSSGRWSIEVDRVRLTGGSWSLTRARDDLTVELDVDERWAPGRLPWLMQLVTTVVPMFRRWPTSYRWHAQVHLGAEPTMTAAWERTGSDRGSGYRRATRS